VAAPDFYHYLGSSPAPFYTRIWDRDVFDYSDKCICGLKGLRFLSKETPNWKTQRLWVIQWKVVDTVTVAPLMLFNCAEPKRKPVKSEPLVKSSSLTEWYIQGLTEAPLKIDKLRLILFRKAIN